MRKITIKRKSGAFLIIFSLLFVLFLSSVGSINVSALEPPRLYGDCNGDNNVDALDFVAFKQYIMEQNHAYDLYKDLNSDNTVDAVDFAILKQFLLGIVKSLPINSAPTQPGVLLVGRFDTGDPAGPKFGWSTSTIKANFKGTGISANLNSMGDNWFNVVIDGVVKSPVNVPSGSSGPVTLATDLTNGNHTIELVRRTEAWIGEVQFLGFNVTDGSLLAPPAPSNRRIEFIGDSITCGYGNEGTSQYQSFTNKNENAYLAYGATTARLLNADPITVCWSGKGLVQNYGGDLNDLMPAVYSRILPYNSTLTWDTSKWIPQVVVINLGTNDFSTGSIDKTTFAKAYTNFVTKIRGQYPDAHIYCAVGPMLSWDQLAKCKDAITSVVDQKNTSGDSKIHFIEFPVQVEANGYGEDWHPSVKTHELMANQLAATIKTDLGW
ncbi:SGNH/GDSL hydrolase family protein [Ruminiclostridium cellulolyticum]|uniref:cellulase n=1 Tax=Ruminiclostridium cellulolyticum (strain ATCC 35319 / DSM 5812 / JCM 6584 / H10) TaxID=394503 RepID=B8I471_RUMCH|nr:SGNH/GDSL hydrolase family protein [Ruminiclostridium cellulolyticum]ACL76504.1 lipolytic protein G-D-S-L family [Ruminiclostridium cellulolyticum H10]